MDILYTAKATASGGRHGSIRSDDGLLDLNLALPKALGGKGGATNPEQLFAGGMLPASRTLCYASAGRLDSGSPTRTFRSPQKSASARTQLTRSCYPPRFS
jgi:hypothetical protein